MGAAFDKSFFLPGEDVGIFEHYGNICFTIVFPLVFLFGMQGIRCFDRFISNIDTNLIKDKFERKVTIEKFLLWLALAEELNKPALKPFSAIFRTIISF